MTRPMTTSPPTTNWPNACTTEPALPVERICRVTETLIASRNIVVSSSRLGNAENSSGAAEVHRRDHDRQARRDVHRDQEVQQHRGQRDDQHRHDQDDADRREQVGVLRIQAILCSESRC